MESCRKVVSASSLAFWSCLVAGWLGWAPEVPAEVRVTAQLSMPRIYLGESVRYRVVVEGDDTGAEPQLGDFDDFDTRLVGRSNGAMRVVTIINGQRQERTEGGPTFEYMLTPRRTGQLTVPGAKVEVAGKAYRAEPLPLEVLDPTDQDLVILELAANRPHVYPSQPFVVSLKVAIKGLPDPFSDMDPLSAVARQMPHLTLPWADDENLPEGIEAVEPAGVWLRPYLASDRNAYGFSINDVHSSVGRPPMGFPGALRIPNLFDEDLFSVFNDERRAAFRPEPTQARRPDQDGALQVYWEYELARTFVATKPGRVRFGPATMQGVFISQTTSGRTAMADRIFALAKPLEMDILDAPVAGRPASYVGAIGRIQADAELAPTRVKVGDPLTLTITLRGEGTLEATVPPQLEQVPEVTRAFKMYEATQETTSDARRFTYSLRPLHAGVGQFPAVPISYFDVQKEQYVTIHTGPIAIDVAAADRLSDTDIAMAPRAHTPQNVDVVSEGVFANITDRRRVVDQRINFQVWWTCLAGMVTAFVAVVWTSRHVRRRRDDVSGRRRRQAPQVARRRVEAATPLVTAGDARQLAAALRASLAGYVADLADADVQSLTSHDVVQAARDLGVNSDDVSRLATFLERCDAARYGGLSQSLESLQAEASELLSDLIQLTGTRKPSP
ncbi:MAG: BatD family protein [Pirellulaceae bacterium]